MEFDYVIIGGGSAGSVLARACRPIPPTRSCWWKPAGEGRSIITRAPLGAASRCGPAARQQLGFRTVPQPGWGRASRLPAARQGAGRLLRHQCHALYPRRGLRLRRLEGRRLRRTGDGRTCCRSSCAMNATSTGERLAWRCGPLQVADQASPNPSTFAFVKAAASVGIPVNDDFTGRSRKGSGSTRSPSSSMVRARASACSGGGCLPASGDDRPISRLSPMPAPRLILEGRMAKGVTIRRGGTREQIFARRRGHRLGRCLRLAQAPDGFGHRPGRHLRSVGVEVVHDLPGVGGNCRTISISSRPGGPSAPTSSASGLPELSRWPGRSASGSARAPG